jgi:hypothetical protein
MRILTVRGIELHREFEKRGFRAVEMYPGGAQDIWGIPRARRDLKGLRKGLQRHGIIGLKKTSQTMNSMPQQALLSAFFSSKTKPRSTAISQTAPSSCRNLKMSIQQIVDFQAGCDRMCRLLAFLQYM